MNKENKKVNDRELKLIFVLGGIVLFFLIYQFGYLNVQKANENLKSQVDEVRGEVKVMQTMKQNEETYKAYTDSMTQEMQEVMDAIPSEIRSEDKIMFARSLEKEYGFHVTGVGLQTDEMVYEMNEDGSNPADDGKLLYRTVVNLDCDNIFGTGTITPSVPSDAAGTEDTTGTAGTTGTTDTTGTDTGR